MPLKLCLLFYSFPDLFMQGFKVRYRKNIPPVGISFRELEPKFYLIVINDI